MTFAPRKSPRSPLTKTAPAGRRESIERNRTLNARRATPPAEVLAAVRQTRVRALAGFIAANGGVAAPMLAPRLTDAELRSAFKQAANITRSKTQGAYA